MNGPNSISWICTTVTCLVVGSLLIMLGGIILAHPSRLKKSSFIYKWWLISMKSWSTKKSPEEPQELNGFQVRFWALITVITGIYLAITGIYGVLRSWGVLESIFIKP